MNIPVDKNIPIVDGIITGNEIKTLLNGLANNLNESLEGGDLERILAAKRPSPMQLTCFGRHKVFRDNIKGRLRPLWQADYRYFKEHKLFAFPQKDYKIR
jgi:hypothetical protein